MRVSYSELLLLFLQTYVARLNLIYNHAQHLASSSNEDTDLSKGGGQQGKDGSSSSAVLTPEMMDFLNGMEEAEKNRESSICLVARLSKLGSDDNLLFLFPNQVLHTATAAARAMREYLSGSN